MLAIGAAAGAASFTHVHNVAASHGQPGWLAWADAIILELMSIASGLELRRRRRAAAPTTFPAIVLGCAVTLSLTAQVVEAEPSPIGWTAAAVPALGFLVMVKVALGHTTAQPSGTPSQAPSPPETPAVPVASRDGPAAVATTAPANAGTTDGGRHSSPVRHRSGGRPRGPTADPDHDDVRTLLPAARSVRDQLAADGQPLTRASLAHHLRGAGTSVSNSKISTLLRILKSEQEPPPMRQHQDREPHQVVSDPRRPPDHADANPQERR
ncbi:DUF2637 domain-containing protein [Paractinoplanes rhizophilus]|uniref:DUF2637 domain-containing protein n=1 Tax=Paractinoplanes rhizophilus TaxID=1416877 RepID=A0ABW2HT86_9ACTN